ncbi:MAG: nucleoside monophosphate kinase [bacterium]|nr:nucleoside monophosphate kinase [bacterium]
MATKKEQYRTILMFGAPGSGKGTQGRVLGDLPGFFHLSCGDVFRGLNHRSELGKTFLAFSSQGKLVPDNFTVQLWLEHIHRLVQTGSFHPGEEILVLDGIPRNRHQAEMMEEYIDVNLLICLGASSNEVLVERMRRRALHENRLDDANEDIIRQRFEAYEAETKPVLEYYPSEMIHFVDTSGTPLDALRGVIQAVESILLTPAG